jgi:hypothetical protein
VRWLQARALDARPEIDGQEDEPAWRRAGYTENLGVASEPVRETPRIGLKVGHFGGSIYLCAAVRGDTTPTDRLEVLFDSEHNHRGCQVVSVGPDGRPETWALADGRRAAWRPRVRCAAGRIEGGWCVEMEIPRESLTDPDNHVIGFNLVHVADGVTMWNPSGGLARSPAGLGHLSLETPPVTVQSVRSGAIVQGNNRLVVAVGNRSAAPVEVRAVLSVLRGQAAPVRRFYTFVLPSSSVQEASLAYLLRGEGEASLELALLDAGVKRRYTILTRRGLVPARAIVHGDVRPSPDGVETPFDLAFDESDLKELVLLATLRQEQGGRTLAVARQEAPRSSKARVRLRTAELEPGRYEMRLTALRQQVIVASEKVEVALPLRADGQGP